MKKILVLSFLLLGLLFVKTAMGQPPPPPPEDIPIDGGLLMLLLGGFAYAGKKLYSKDKESDR